jgi:acetyl-CoA acetyltransferase
VVVTSLPLPPPERALSGKAAIVGLGETDYPLDYRAARSKAPDYDATTQESLAATAFERALDDAGLTRAEIDGLSVSFTYGGPPAAEIATTLGLHPRWLIDNVGIMAGPLPIVCGAIAAGECDSVAMVYAVAPSKLGRIFGGQTIDGPPNPPSYYYYHPWGWSSQAAHWAFGWQHYQNVYGATEADLGSVAVQLRENALTNSNAVMTAPMSIEDYLASRYIVKPLHLFDMCMVNDGAVCLIVRRADMARDMPHAPVLVTGWGEARVKSNKMHMLVRERLRPLFDKAGGEALAMAGITIRDVQHFEGYDAATSHLVTQVEGHGFVEPGSGLEFCKSGEMAVGGALPVNTAGGMISGSYMHGWNHVAEITRQLRHEAGMRQIEGVEISISSLTQTDQVHPIIFRRGA